MGQMASFSTLEQVTEPGASARRRPPPASPSACIGRTVTYRRHDGAEHTGVVEKVSTKDGKPVLTVGGTDGVDPSTITQVA